MIVGRGAAFVLAFVLLAGCGGSTVSPAGGAGASSSGIMVSDLHFNPLADKTLAHQLANAPASQWDAIFATSTQTGFSPDGQDTNVALLQSALTAMRRAVPTPAIVFVAGDFLAHGLPLFYASDVPGGTATSYAAFADTTERYLAIKLAETFPNAQIVPTLGDWDSACFGDQFPGPEFLTAFASSWNGAVNRYGGAPDFLTSFATGGYYATAFPIVPRGRLIVLDSPLWSSSYAGGCGGPSGTGAGDAEMTWLQGQLADARQLGQRVWILGHMPPGIEAACTLAAPNSQCPTAVHPFYADAFSVPLYALFAQYRDVIAFGIFGHEHRDDFRLALDAAGNLLFGMKGSPAISPFQSNNPAFVQFTFDPGAGAIADATTWYLTNLATASTANPGIWQAEYGFDLTYGQRAMDASGIAGAVAAIRSQTVAQQAYTRYYAASNAAATFTTFTPYGCALIDLTATAYAACAGQPP